MTNACVGNHRLGSYSRLAGCAPPAITMAPKGNVVVTHKVSGCVRFRRSVLNDIHAAFEGVYDYILKKCT